MKRLSGLVLFGMLVVVALLLLSSPTGRHAKRLVPGENRSGNSETDSSDDFMEKPAVVPVSDRQTTASPSLTAGEIDLILALHNRARGEVGTDSLVWSSDLSAYAQEWADHLAAEGRGLEHRPTAGLWKRVHGENLFMGTAGAFAVGDAVDSWVEEKQFYHGEALTESDWHESGHYMQVVWKGTKAVGCAKALSNGEMIVVCNYSPPGNVLGQSAH